MWLSQHQFLQWAASSVPGSGPTGSLASSQPLKHRWLHKLPVPSGHGQPAGPPSQQLPQHQVTSCKVPSETPPPVQRSLHFRELIYRKFHRCSYCSSLQWALAASDGPFSKNVQISAWGREEGEGSRGFCLGPGCESCALYLPFLYLRVHFYVFLNNPVTVNTF